MHSNESRTMGKSTAKSTSKITGTNSDGLKNQVRSKSESLKWVRSIRALPTHPSNNDNLKTEYIEVNLNNSRKLIGNINDLEETSNNSVQYNHELNESLARINNIKHELEWLNEL